MKLRYLPGSCSFVAHVALEWIGQPYEAIPVSPEELASPAYRKLNPVGKVPLLIDGDFVLSQSFAILHYLHEKYPDCPAFGGKSPREHAHFHQWLALANCDFHKCFTIFFHADRYTETDAGREELKRKALEGAAELFKIVSDELGDNDFLMGELNLADVFLYVMLRGSHVAGLDLEPYGNLLPYRDRIEKSHYVAAVLKAEGLPPLHK